MPDLLLELFSEEIPARMQKNAERDLADLFTQAMAKEGFTGCTAATFSTPRRLALLCADIPAAQPDVATELKGPKITAPAAALEGFLKKNNLKKSDLTERDGIYFVTLHQKGKPTAELLKLLIEGIVQNFPWPKSMRWGTGDVTWVRPLHSILCIFDGRVVPVEFGGVKAGNVTYGHRFLNPEAITITSPAEYEAKLEKTHVIVDREKRKAEILKQAEKAVAAKGLFLRKDEGLLEEVTGLVEYPVVLMGTIDAKFMDLPKELLISEMRAHQKYFSLFPSPAGRGWRDAPGEGDAANAASSMLHSPHPSPLPEGEGIAPHFLITANMKTKDGGKAIVAGNERVLRARLADGRFFWDQDRKKRLDEWAEGLANITFHAKLGSVADKVERIKNFASLVMSHWSLANDQQPMTRDYILRAASLCKADLTTGMVGEFPELQGVMGRYYAYAQGEKPEVADAIREHYLPLGPNSEVPTKPVSICVALADKLDTLISMFAIGEKPTGSKDPFALRRAALGVIRIILENNLRLPLKPLFANPPVVTIATHMAQEKLVKKTESDLHKGGHKIGKYVSLNETVYEELGEAVPSNLGRMLYDFFIDRLKVQMKDSGIRHDVINAVVADGDDDLVRIVNRARALQDFLKTEDGANLLIAYKRAANILAIEEKKDNRHYEETVNTAILTQNEEINLSNMLFLSFGTLAEKMKREGFTETMQILSQLRAPIDQFFDKVMVNCENKELRIERLKLLALIRNSMNRIANFALVEG